MADRVAIVTGAGRGIGRAISMRLAREGYDVVGLARNERELAETSTHIGQLGGECLVLPTDVSDPQQVGRAVSKAMDRFSRVDALVNNAGVAPLAPVARMPLEAFDECIRVNVDATFYCCQAVLPLMAAQGSGTIINMSSIAAEDPFPGFAAYGATKAWVNTFTKALAAEMTDSGIRVFAVAPGAVETAMFRTLFPDFPPEKCLSPEDVAEAVLGLLNPLSSFTTGQICRLCR